MPGTWYPLSLCRVLHIIHKLYKALSDAPGSRLSNRLLPTYLIVWLWSEQEHIHLLLQRGQDVLLNCFRKFVVRKTGTGVHEALEAIRYGFGERKGELAFAFFPHQPSARGLEIRDFSGSVVRPQVFGDEKFLDREPVPDFEEHDAEGYDFRAVVGFAAALADDRVGGGGRRRRGRLFVFSSQVRTLDVDGDPRLCTFIFGLEKDDVGLAPRFLKPGRMAQLED